MILQTNPQDLWSAPALPGSAVWQAVDSLIASGRRLGLVVTGGGSRAVTWLLDHPGASRAVVEVCVPYSGTAIDTYLGSSGPHRATSETARRLALRARERAAAAAADTGADGSAEGVIGAGCTAALITDRPRRGADRGHLACRLDQEYLLVDLYLDRGGRNRAEQEGVLSAALLGALVRSCGADDGALPPPPRWARVETSRLRADPGLEDLLAGERQALWWGPAAAAAPAHGDLILVSGSFNPLHEGHLALLDAAARRSGRTAALELSVTNVDKPTLAYEEVLRRLEDLPADVPVVLTCAPTFAEKARLFPGTWYGIGCDTAQRLLEPRYYGGIADGVSQSLDELTRHGAHFVVAGRVCDGDFTTAADLSLPGHESGLFTGLAEGEFRVDVSSTELRRSSAAGKSALRSDDEGQP